MKEWMYFLRIGNGIQILDGLCVCAPAMSDLEFTDDMDGSLRHVPWFLDTSPPKDSSFLY